MNDLKDPQTDQDRVKQSIIGGKDAITAVVDVPAPIRPTLEAFQEAIS